MLRYVQRFLLLLILLGAIIGYRVTEKMLPNEYAWAYGFATWLIFCVFAGVIYHIAVAIQYNKFKR